MKVYGNLERAQLEVIADPATASLTGRVWWNATDGQAKVADGTNEYALLRNDLKAIIGNSGTATDNVRFHRGDVQVLQLLRGSDATAEGSLGTNLTEIDAKHLNRTNAALPSPGNAGRVVWNSTFNALNVDTGSAWSPLGGGGGVGSFLNFYPEPGNGPIEGEDGSGLLYWEFTDEGAEVLWAFLKVPESYQAGQQLSLAVTVESDETGSAQINFQAQTYLVRTGTDAMTSLANSHTDSTNYSPAAVAATELVVNLMDSSGDINAVAVSAGDVLKIKLTKPTDASTENLRLFQSLVEVRS